MVETIQEQIAHDHPDFVELANLLDLAELTWRRYGLSAAQISEMDAYTRQLIYIRLRD